VEVSETNLENGDCTPWDLTIGKCSFCGKENVECEVLINNKGGKVNVCEKCEAGEEE